MVTVEKSPWTDVHGSLQHSTHPSAHLRARWFFSWQRIRDIHEGHLLLEKPHVHSKATCPSQHTLVSLFSTQRRDRMRSFSFPLQQGLFPTLQKVLDSQCHQLEGVGVKRGLFEMCDFLLDNPGHPLASMAGQAPIPFRSLSHFPLSSFGKGTEQDKHS